MYSTKIYEKIETIEKQLLCFETKNIYDKFRESLCLMFANFILDLRNNQIDELYEKLDIVFKNNLEIIDSKIFFRTYDVSKIAVVIYQKLYKEDKKNVFENYIQLIEKYIYENSKWYFLDFNIFSGTVRNSVSV